MSKPRESPSTGAGSADVFGFYEDQTGSIQYVVVDPSGGAAAIIDPVLDFDAKSASVTTASMEAIISFIEERELTVEWVLDTHPHADHFSAGHRLARHFEVPHAIGARVAEVAEIWRELYNQSDSFQIEECYDQLWQDRDRFELGELPVEVVLSPGHTLASVTYRIGSDTAFVHDTLMQPDKGTSRADFPGGSAEELYDSIQEILSWPDATRVFVGHDYGTEDRDRPEWESTIEKQRDHNVHVGGGVGKEEYVERRESRDAELELPDLMLAALQINLRGGRLPGKEADGHRYLKIPLNRFQNQNTDGE